MRVHRRPEGAQRRTGKLTLNVVSPGPDCSEISPRCCLTTMLYAMLRPNPVPTPGAFVVKKASKMRGWIPAGMPGPLSVISTTMSSLPRVAGSR